MLVAPRLVLISDISTKKSGLISGIWRHEVSQGGLEHDRPLGALIDEVREAEWRGELDRNDDLREAALKLIAGELLDEQTASGTHLDALFRAVLAPEWHPRRNGASIRDTLLRLRNLAEQIQGRPTIVGLSIDENAAQEKAFFIAKELAANQPLVLENKVAFIRLEKESSPAFAELMRHVMSTIAEAKVQDDAKKEGARLLVGETGVGKSELARALHQQLKRQLGRSGSFIHVNIAAISKDLLEARLRGHAKGTFTGATADRQGWFEEAEDGTLFLDELQAAPKEFQVQLLDLLNAVSDTVEIARIGSDQNRKRLRVRVIMATNEGVEHLIEKDRLRKDLYYRIRSVHNLSPLAERIRANGTDDHFLERLLRLHRWRSAAPMAALAGGPARHRALDEDRLRACLLPDNMGSKFRAPLREHDWPGNLREFERVCFDVFQTYDGGPRNWTEDEWSEAFERAIDSGRIPSTVGKGAANAAASGTAPEIREGAKADKDREVRQVLEMQEILCRHGFNVRAAQPDLKDKGLRSSPGAIRNILRKRQSHLDKPRWTTRKAKKLLGTE